MANEGELPGWLTPILAASTFVGGVFAAMLGKKGKKPAPESPENGEAMLAQRIARLESVVQTHSEKLARAEIDRQEGRATVDKLFEKIDKTQEDVSEIKGMLQAQRRSQ